MHTRKNEGKAWFHAKGREFDEDTLITLYKRYHESMGEMLNRHFSVRNYYTVLLSALVGLYVVGIYQLAIERIEMAEWLSPYLVLLSLPVMVIMLSVIALKSTTRYYTGFLRMVALIAKIENMLGLDGQVRTKEEKPREPRWEKDKEFMDEYYLESRRDFESSKDFIKEKKWQGDNRLCGITFGLFIAIGVIFFGWHLFLLCSSVSLSTSSILIVGFLAALFLGVLFLVCIRAILND